MGNIAAGSEHLPILQNHCIPKVYRKVADTVDSEDMGDGIKGSGEDRSANQVLVDYV